MQHHIEFIRRAKELADTMFDFYTSDELRDVREVRSIDGKIIAGGLLKYYGFEDETTELCSLVHKIEDEFREMYSTTDEKVFTRHFTKFQSDLSKIIDKVSTVNPVGFDPDNDMNIEFYSPLSREDQIKFFHCVLGRLDVNLKNEYQTNEPELPPIDATLKSAANYVALLHKLGIIEHLKNKFPYLPAQRLGELCQLITGKKTDYFREAISSANPEKTRAFNDTSRCEVESQLVKFGIGMPKKKAKN